MNGRYVSLDVFFDEYRTAFGISFPLYYIDRSIKLLSEISEERLPLTAAGVCRARQFFFCV